MRLHNNDVEKCQFCPYTYAHEANYAVHLEKHFHVNDYTCDHCGLKFSSKKSMLRHSTLHEGIVLSCLICRKYKASYQPTILQHLRKKHGDVVGKNVNWDAVKHFVKRDSLLE